MARLTTPRCLLRPAASSLGALPIFSEPLTIIRGLRTFVARPGGLQFASPGAGLSFSCVDEKNSVLYSGLVDAAGLGGLLRQ